MRFNQGEGFQCWHRVFMVGKHKLCKHCGVQVEWCCLSHWRMGTCKSDCPFCRGSGWVAVVRGSAARFADYLSRCA